MPPDLFAAAEKRAASLGFKRATYIQQLILADLKRGKQEKVPSGKKARAAKKARTTKKAPSSKKALSAKKALSGKAAKKKKSRTRK